MNYPATKCEGCSHWRRDHNAAIGCLICHREIELVLLGRMQPYPGLHMCKASFRSPFSTREIEQAKAAAKDSYHAEMPCAMCGEFWMTHQGYLCPSGVTLFVPALSEKHGAFSHEA